MLKSLNECTPQEMLALKASELKEAIRLSEGRVVTTLSRVRGPNYLQYVTNAEVCAAFGSDILYLDTYNPRKPYFPGLVSKIQKTMNHSETFKFKSEKDGRREKFGLW